MNGNRAAMPGQPFDKEEVTSEGEAFNVVRTTLARQLVERKGITSCPCIQLTEERV